MKLNRPEHEALTRIAEVYGTTTGAMARMLINRGVQAVVASLAEEGGATGD